MAAKGSKDRAKLKQGVKQNRSLFDFMMQGKAADKDTGRETEMKSDTREEIVSSGSTAKKSKLCLTDTVREAGSISGGEEAVVALEEWYACDTRIQAIGSSLAMYTVKIAEIKTLLVAYQKFLTCECLTADLHNLAEQRVSYMNSALQDIYGMEIRSMTLVSIFSSFSKNDKFGLLKLHCDLTDHEIAANQLYGDACQWVEEHQAWLDGR